MLITDQVATAPCTDCVQLRFPTFGSVASSFIGSWCRTRGWGTFRQACKCTTGVNPKLHISIDFDGRLLQVANDVFVRQIGKRCTNERCLAGNNRRRHRCPAPRCISIVRHNTYDTGARCSYVNPRSSGGKRSRPVSRCRCSNRNQSVHVFGSRVLFSVVTSIARGRDYHETGICGNRKILTVAATPPHAFSSRLPINFVSRRVDKLKLMTSAPSAVHRPDRFPQDRPPLSSRHPRGYPSSPAGDASRLRYRFIPAGTSGRPAAGSLAAPSPRSAFPASLDKVFASHPLPPPARQSRHARCKRAASS